MKFKYRYFRYGTSPAKELGKLPILEVRLAHGDNYIDIDCLIDSGAGDCLFSDDLADELKIDLEGAEEKDYLGIGGQVITGRVYPVQLRIKGFSEWIEVKAGFLPADEMPLLGQSGFFDNYEVTFRRFRGRFEVKSRTYLHAGAGNKYLM